MVNCYICGARFPASSCEISSHYIAVLGPRWCSGQRLFVSHSGEPGSIPAGLLTRIFARGNRSGRCRWPAGFLEDPLPPPPPPTHSGAAPCSPRFTLIGSQDQDVKSRTNLSTQLTVDIIRSGHCQACQKTLMIRLVAPSSEILQGVKVLDCNTERRCNTAHLWMHWRIAENSTRLSRELSLGNDVDGASWPCSRLLTHTAVFAVVVFTWSLDCCLILARTMSHQPSSRSTRTSPDDNHGYLRGRVSFLGSSAGEIEMAAVAYRLRLLASRKRSHFREQPYYNGVLYRVHNTSGAETGSCVGGSADIIEDRKLE
ncbi:hypothetical protein PR048_000060 [Dryococelus australis]|uniref:Uncharacterized protein n=1 Tax=Dryococelus australis TaxID=614101 RepID=A0ABQ9IDK6_9NEOP|nr:hypothetical protein PR048_000060 [Dryococelus australis]